MLQLSRTIGCEEAAFGPEPECITQVQAMVCVSPHDGHGPSAKNTLHDCSADEHVGHCFLKSPAAVACLGSHDGVDKRLMSLARKDSRKLLSFPEFF